jgi:5-methylcytosine-specific restriction endonuclease McrA
MSHLNRLCLVINATYQGINVTSARRALTLVFKGAAVVEEVSAFTVRTARINVPVPAVVRLVKYRRVPRQNRAVSRKGILLRDRSTCQYCGINAELAATLRISFNVSLDHVIPRSRQGQSTWDNLVAACLDCNNRKGDRTPEEAGMILARQPRQVSIHAKHRLMAGDSAIWNKYLFA